MLEDISVYKDTKRNELCPCGSGKIFKNCCMKEYRELKKSGGTRVKLSTYSPLKPLEKQKKQAFTDFYTKLMIYSNQSRYQSDSITIENEKENMQSFIQKERIHFYKNHVEIINQYIQDENPKEEEMIILNALKSAKLDEFFLLSVSDDYAVIMDKKENFYNIQALNSPFSEIFNQKEKYLAIKTALIPYKDRYITDGIFTAGIIPKESREYFDSLPYKNPQIIYNQDNDYINLQFALTFSMGTKVENFKTMEEVLLKKVPKDFTLGIKEQLKTEFTNSTSIISSFIRTTDFLELLDNEKGNQTLSYIFGGLPMSNFERDDKNGVIPYELLEYYYKQVAIDKSVSVKAYNNAKKQRESLFSTPKAFSTFYTMLGIVSIKKKHIDDFFEFIESFKSKKKREPIAIGVENLCEDLSNELDFQIDSVFIDACVDLNEIKEQLSEYYHYMQSGLIPSTKKAQKYSRKRGK